MRGIRNTTNAKVRTAMAVHGLYQWMLAEMLGWSETTLSRALRYEWTDEAQDAVIELINGERDDPAEVREIIKHGGGRTSNYRKDGTIYESQLNHYADEICKQVDYVEAVQYLVKKGYL